MNAKQEIKQAYDFWKAGRIAKIWQVRRESDLPNFDQVINELVQACQVQLVGGDPSTMTDDQIADSLTRDGILYIGIIWRF